MRAIDASLLVCHTCGKLVPDVEAHGSHQKLHCPRCHAALHMRKTNSVQRTWAYLVAAAILYIPANLFPIMTLKMFGKGEPHTIMGGVIELIHAESYECAILVLFASVAVPLLKLLGLAFLLISVQLKWQWRPRDRTLLYRIIELVGRWSMIDVFMVSILVALVNVEAIAYVEPGIGASFFAAVVIATMFAASSFDPRLIWDRLEEDDGQ